MKLVTKSTLAKLQDVNKSTATRWCAGPLEAAMVDDRVDLEHEAAKDFFRKRRAEQQAKDAAFRMPGAGVADQLRGSFGATGGPGPDPSSISFADFDDVYSMTVREVAERYGPIPLFIDYLKAYNLLQDARKKRIANDEKEGRLISRQTVEVAVLGQLEAFNRRLLSDAVETGTRLLFGHCNAGDSIEVGRATLSEILSSHLTPARDQIVQSLLDAASDEPESEDEGAPQPMVDAGAA